MTKLPKLRFSIDIGGTFTDIAILDEETGQFRLNKSLSTPEDTLAGLLNVIEKAELNLSSVERFFVHGSTTALNTLLERKGTKTGYLATKGFRDVPEIGRINRPELYNPKYHKPAQIVPRELRFEVTERVNAEGEVLIEIDEEELRNLSQELVKKRVAALAICFLHSFQNPVHEITAKDRILSECPGLSVSISSEVAPEHREFERSMTTILNAYLAPAFRESMTRLEEELDKRGFKGQTVITRSDGGGMTVEAARMSPINTLLSGPAGGVIGGQFIAKRVKRPNLITMDMGGTSLDVCLINDGQIRTEQQTKVHGYPLLISNFDIRTVGAGGGSIARVDGAGALHVGPQSAGARPGPISYGRGGTEPTVTDALLCNGYIDPEYFLGGEMHLNLEGAKEEIETKICAPLNMDLHNGCSGILRITLSNLAEAVKDIAAEKGDDPRDFSLLCYGGGGPLFGSLLLQELEVQASIVPVAPANFSAWGMLMVDVRHDFSLTFVRTLDTVTLEELDNRFNGLVNKGMEVLGKEKVPKEHRKIRKSLDMRYSGQEHTLSLPLDFHLEDDWKEQIHEAFNRTYTDVYGYALTRPVELVNIRVTAVGEMPKPVLGEIEQGPTRSDAGFRKTRRVFDTMKKDWVEYSVFQRDELLAENLIQGPALIEDPTTVTVVMEDHQCQVDGLGNLIITNR